MSKYHISDTTGKPEKCSASIKSCPIGGSEEHHNSVEEANVAAEKKFGDESNYLASKNTPTESSFDNGNNAQAIINNPREFKDWSKLSFEQTEKILTTGLKEMNGDNAEKVIDVFRIINENGNGKVAKRFLYDLTRVRPDATKNLPVPERQRLHSETMQLLEDYNKKK